jgi:TIR domain
VDQGQNVYVPPDDTSDKLPSGPKVFISHRSSDKPLARALARLLSSLDVHYWLDEEDRDLQRAAELGMLGEKGLVHAIERGVNHATTLLGVVSSRTAGSWWVPYEIGFSRAAGKSANFVLTHDARDVSLPSYARIAATYTSVDEIARWASTLSGHHLHSDLTAVPETRFQQLTEYDIPLDPLPPTPIALCDRALSAIEILANAAAHEALKLTSRQFDWLPTKETAVAEIAYDLLAPLAYVQLKYASDPDVRRAMEMAYQAPTQHYEIAAEQPPLEYAPTCEEWKSQRYLTPERTWLQGLERGQLAERVESFLATRDRRGRLRMATKDEFKAEFNRILQSRDERSRRSLGVLLNPLFGFTPKTRPVFWRVLCIQWVLYESITGRRPSSPFDEHLRRLAHNYVEQRTSA